MITTMLTMGLSTVAIGFVPDYSVIGIWGAYLLTAGRVLQGLAVGGAWSGSVLLAGEWTDPARRGFTTSFAQFGAPAGYVLANGALALMTAIQSDRSFLDWGWRVPFLLSIVLVGVGLWTRIGILETPVFAKLKANRQLEKTPIVEVLRRNWREVLLSAFLRTGQQVPFYLFGTYILTYGTTVLGFARGTILVFVMVMVSRPPELPGVFKVSPVAAASDTPVATRIILPSTATSSARRRTLHRVLQRQGLTDQNYVLKDAAAVREQSMQLTSGECDAEERSQPPGIHGSDRCQRGGRRERFLVCRAKRALGCGDQPTGRGSRRVQRKGLYR